MIIQIISRLIEEGYLSSESYTSLSPFFSGANVAFRREALSQVGPYDVNCLSGEDQDMCLRMARAGWDLYFEPRAIVRHKNAMSARAFVRRWFYYGLHHPYIFKKHGSGGITVYKRSLQKRGQSPYGRLFNVKFPFAVHVFLTTFLAFNLVLLLAMILALLGLFIPALVALLITMIVAVFYFKVDFSRKHFFRGFAFIFLRYIANLVLLAGGFLGGIKSKLLYISATFD